MRSRHHHGAACPQDAYTHSCAQGPSNLPFDDMCVTVKMRTAGSRLPDLCYTVWHASSSPCGLASLDIHPDANKGNWIIFLCSAATLAWSEYLGHPAIVSVDAVQRARSYASPSGPRSH